MKGLLVALVFFGILAFACGQNGNGLQSVTLVKGQAASPVEVNQVEATPIVQEVAATPVTVQEVQPVAVPSQQQEVIVTSSATSLSAFWMF
jgi:hypothetical protein